MKDLGMSRRNWQGDAEGIAGGACDRGGGKSPVTGESGGPPPPKKKEAKFGCFLLQSRHSSALFHGQDFSLINLKKNFNFTN